MSQNHVPGAPGELSLAITLIFSGFGRFMAMLTNAEPALAALSYLVAIIAGLVTVYYKIKGHGKDK